MSNEKLTVFTGFLKYLPKNMALLAQKLWRKFLSKSVSRYFKTKKRVPMATKPRGGGAKCLSGRATKKRTFFAASLTQDK